MNLTGYILNPSLEVKTLLTPSLKATGLKIFE